MPLLIKGLVALPALLCLHFSSCVQQGFKCLTMFFWSAGQGVTFEVTTLSI
jgi:hypothetical protein